MQSANSFHIDPFVANARDACQTFNLGTPVPGTPVPSLLEGAVQLAPGIPLQEWELELLNCPLLPQQGTTDLPSILAMAQSPQWQEVPFPAPHMGIVQGVQQQSGSADQSTSLYTFPQVSTYNLLDMEVELTLLPPLPAYHTTPTISKSSSNISGDTTKPISGMGQYKPRSTPPQWGPLLDSKPPNSFCSWRLCCNCYCLSS